MEFFGVDVSSSEEVRDVLWNQVENFEWKTGETRFTQFEWLTTTLVCYFLSVALLTKFMESRETKLQWVDGYAFIHNLTLSFLSLVMLVSIVIGATMDGRFTSWNSFICKRPLGESKGLVPFTLYFIYLSKILEFGDTWIMVSSKRSVHWMHRLHHLSTMGMVWHALDTNMAADVLCACTNLLGHVLLYLYFAFPTPAFRGWINLSQILQFGGCLLGVGYMVYRRCIGDACEGSVYAEIHGIIMYSIYIVHMVHQYTNRYKSLRKQVGVKGQTTKHLKSPANPNEIDSSATIANVLAQTSTPCGDLGDVLSPCGELLTQKLITPCASESQNATRKKIHEPEDGAGLTLSIPAELFRKSFSPALRIVAKTIAIGLMGVASIAYLPSSMSPIGILLIGMAMSWLLVIGVDCSQGSFFPSRVANDIVGTLALLPLLRTVEAFRFRGNSGAVESKTSKTKVSPTYTQSLSKFFLGAGDGTPSSLSLSHVTVFVFGIAFMSSMAVNHGTSGLIKYWVLPYVVMHINMKLSSANSRNSTDPTKSKGPATYQVLFPELSDFTKLPEPLQLAVAELDFGRIPLYNLPKAFEVLAEGATEALSTALDEGEDAVRRILFVSKKGAKEDKLAQAPKPGFADRLFGRLPSRLFLREVLYWQHRDIIVWITLAIGVAMTSNPTSVTALTSKLPPSVSATMSDPTKIALVPMAVFLVFLFPKMTARTAISHFNRSSHLYKNQLSQKELVPDTIIAEEQEKKDQAAIAKFESTQNLPWLQYYLANANYPMGIYISLCHVLAIIALPALIDCDVRTLIWAFALWPISGLGITAGAHRLWAHRSYNASLPFRFVVMLFNSIANQGNIYHWSRDHRVHHKWSETTSDPHNALRGFFFAHMGWLYVVKDPRVAHAGRKIHMGDLLEMPEVVLQRKLDPFWNLFWCFAFPMFVAHYGWGESLYNGFFVPGALRYVMVLHFTWCVNSAAHLWGETPYETMNPAENPWVSIGAIGEGWHNWHHTFPYDYAASELGVSKQYNPTKMFIDLFAKLGMVWRRRRADEHWKKRMLRRARAAAPEVERESLKDVPDDELIVDEKLIGYPMLKRRVITLKSKAPQKLKTTHDESNKEALSEQEKKDQAAIAKFESTQNLPWLQYYLANANYPMSIYISLCHVLAIIALPALIDCDVRTLIWAFALWPISGLGITAGAHRLWAHRSYNASLPFRFVVMLFNSIANQGNIYHWSRDHRVHHKWSETTSDPHNALRGFFFAHMGWLYVVKDPRVAHAGRKIHMGDLLEMPEVVLQRKLDPFWNLFWCFAFPMFVAHYGWGESLYNGFFVPGALRYVMVLHFTWCVNSAAHLWGETPYETMNPAENPWVSIGAIGEGWHNWHHTFPYDYAASELGVSKQYNPTKMFIDLFAKLGMVWRRRRADEHWKKRMLRRARAAAPEVERESLKDVPDDELIVDEKLIGYPMLKRRVITLKSKAPQKLKTTHDESNKEALSEQEKKDQAAIAKFESTQNLPWLQYYLANANYPMSIYISLCHVLAIIALPALIDCDVRTLIWAFALWPISGLGITAGAHRLWAHRSYNAALPFRFVVMLFNSIANQGNIYHWSRDHRVHHKWSETTSDPHNALRGFFFAHMGWLYVVKDPRVAHAGRKIHMGDLLEMPEVVLQRKLDPFWNLFWCFAFPMFVAHYGWGESLYNGFFVPGALRYVMVLHFTWCVNSAAHLWGETPYETMNPAENPWVSIGAIGEGWHNWHHTFPYDYAASELGVSKQYNPTKMFIDLFAKLGMVWRRRRADEHWKKRMLRRARAAAPEAERESLKDVPDDELIVDEKLIGYPMLKRRVITLKSKTQ